MKKTKYNAVLLDFDGTIVDSSAGIFASLIYAFQKDHTPVPPEEKLRLFIGPPLKDSFMELFGYSAEKAEWMIEKYREHYRVDGWKMTKLYAGIPTLLEHLKQAGIRLGTASTKPKFFVKEILDAYGLTSYFDYLGGTEFDGEPQTKAQIITQGMQMLGTSQENTLMVGDRKFDIDGAKEAGVPCAAVLYGFGSKAEFQEHGATFIVSNVKDLQHLILKDE